MLYSYKILKNLLRGLGCTLFVLLVLGAVPLLSSNMAFSEEPITVSVEKTSYDKGEKIIITGNVSYILSGHAVTLTVFSPQGNLVTVSQVNVSEDNTFQTEIIAGGMMKDGTHTINVQYGSLKIETSFDYNYPDIMNGWADFHTMQVTDSDLSVEYTITGGTLLSIIPDTNTNSLVLSITSTQDGTITLDIPRTVADSLLETGDDDMFVVLVDDSDTMFDETVSSTHRTLTIPFSAGTTQIEIIGTFVIPEFGSVVMLILVISIISIIIISSKSRLILRV